MSFLGSSVQGSESDPLAHGSQSDAAVANGNSTTVKAVRNQRGCRSAKLMVKTDQNFDIRIYGWDTTFAAVAGKCEVKAERRLAETSTAGAWICYYLEIAGWNFVAPMLKNVSGGGAMAGEWAIQFFD